VIFFSADCHFNHGNSIDYCRRPFGNVDEMNSEIIKRWNNKVSKDDIVYHVGDFVFKYKGTDNNFEKKLNGKIIHIRGNHDSNNGTKTNILNCVLEIYGLRVYVVHTPPSEGRSTDIEKEIVNSCDLVLCGHVHNNWKYKEVFDTPVINVGTDVWNFEPITLNSVLKLLRRRYDIIETEEDFHINVWNKRIIIL